MFAWYAREDSNLWPLAPEDYSISHFPPARNGMITAKMLHFSRSHAVSRLSPVLSSIIP